MNDACVRCDEQDGARHLVGTADALLRVERGEVGLAIRSAGEAVQHARVDRAGCDRVHPHAERAGLERHRLRQPFDRMLARRIDRGAGAAFVPEGRGDVDDAAAALSLHHAQLVLHAEHRAEHVGVERRRVALGGLLRRGSGLALRAGRVDGDVEAPESGDRLIDEGAHLVLVANVGADELGFGAGGAQVGGEVRHLPASRRPETTTRAPSWA